MVPGERLELSRVAPLVPKTSASTNFATSAFCISVYSRISFGIQEDFAILLHSFMYDKIRFEINFEYLYEFCSSS